MIRIFEYPYLVLLTLVELIAALTGVLYFKKYKDSKMKYFIYFLVYIAFFASLMTYTFSVRYNGVLSFLDTTIFRTNHWLDTLYWSIGAMLFYSWFFFKFIKSIQYKRIIKWLSLLFLIFSIIIIAIQFNRFFSSKLLSITIVGNSLLIISISFYFIEILQSDKLLNFYKTNMFYIATIIFIWLLITIPLGFYDHYFNLQDPEYVKLRSAIYFYVNLFMYLGFASILIFGKPEKSINN